MFRHTYVLGRILKFEKLDCTPCKQVDAYLEKLGIADKVEHINAFDNPEYTSKMGIRSLPTILVLDDDGNEVEKITGFKPERMMLLKAVK